MVPITATHDPATSVRNGNRDTISMVGVQPGQHILTVVPASLGDLSQAIGAALVALYRSRVA